MDAPIQSFSWHASLDNFVAVTTRNNRLDVFKFVQTPCAVFSPLNQVVICGNGSISLYKILGVNNHIGTSYASSIDESSLLLFKRALTLYGFNVRNGFCIRLSYYIQGFESLNSLFT